jgi:peptidoglycan/LPS O-acetylase OafA/YrhL
VAGKALSAPPPRPANSEHGAMSKMTAQDDTYSKNNGESQYLNIVRLLAALIVIVGHIRTNFFLDYSMIDKSVTASILYAPTTLGGGAVIVFFALSGYLVGGPILRNRNQEFDFKGYFLKRIVRLWLVLIPALILTAVLDSLGMAILGNSDIYKNANIYANFPKGIDHSFAVFLGNMFFLRDEAPYIFGYNTPLWSLAYEFWYYILFPSFIFLFKNGPNFRQKLVALCLVILSAYAAGLAGMALFPAWLFGAIAGARPGLLFSIRDRIGNLPWALCQMLAALMIVLAMIAARASGEVYPYLGSALIGLVTSVAFLFLNSDGFRPNMIANLFSNLSKCTYSLYTIHMPIIVIVAAFLVPSYHGRWNLVSLSGLFIPAFAFLILLVALVFASFTEAKTNQVRKRVAAVLGW